MEKGPFERRCTEEMADEIVISVSVRTLVEFLLRSGDLDNRSAAASEDAMLTGARMHRRLQKAQGPDYESEVTLSWQYVFSGR
jgi:DNA excision repair protein ERCC-2